MGSLRVLTAALVLSCSADDTGVLKDTADTTSEVDTGIQCVSDVEDDLPDPYAPTVGQEGACDSALYWDKVPGAVSFFLGDFTVDSCGDVSGEEAWVLFPNAKWQEVGGESCVVVWNVSGLLGGPLQEGSLALQLSLTVDTMATDCEPNADGVPVYVGETSVTVDYDVQMNSDGTAVFRYPDSGVQLGEGSWNEGHLTYTSDHGCKFF